ncbi:MAG TPA: hypothetical protein VMU38_03095 [Candidatus Binatia bacterium]|nr:hypothetical protein [Candidatus Binatia bacterium]
MTAPPQSLPLSNHRARLERYLRGIALSTGSVAGQIIEERRSARYEPDPMRPCLVLWACAAGNGDLDDALPVAAAFDLFDRFLLLHDELDGDSPAADVWGLGQSLNAGDALFALGFRTLASDVSHPARRLEAARLVAEAVLEAIERSGDEAARSALLTGAAMRAGAVIAGLPENVALEFSRAGRLLGAAALDGDARSAESTAAQALAALAECTASADREALEEVARYVAQRAA